jgi:hypothetical protein
VKFCILAIIPSFVVTVPTDVTNEPLIEATLSPNEDREYHGGSK